VITQLAGPVGLRQCDLQSTNKHRLYRIQNNRGSLYVLHYIYVRTIQSQSTGNCTTQMTQYNTISYAFTSTQVNRRVTRHGSPNKLPPSLKDGKLIFYMLFVSWQCLHSKVFCLSADLLLWNIKGDQRNWKHCGQIKPVQHACQRTTYTYIHTYIHTYNIYIYIYIYKHPNKHIYYKHPSSGPGNVTWATLT